MIRAAEESVLPQVLREAARAYCLGLYGATALLCRTTLEVYLSERLKRVPQVVKEVAETEKLADLIRIAARLQLLRQYRQAADGSRKSAEADRTLADRIRDAGRSWAHGKAVIASPNRPADCAHLFWDTIELLERMESRKPLSAPQRYHRRR